VVTKKRINTELYYDRTAALFIGKIQISVVTNEGDKRVGFSLLEEQVYPVLKYCLEQKGNGMKDLASTYLEMSLAGM